MDRSKPLVVAGALLLGVATALVATGTALGLVSLAPPETRIGRVQPIHTQQPAAPVVDLTPIAPAGQGGRSPLLVRMVRAPLRVKAPEQVRAPLRKRRKSKTRRRTRSRRSPTSTTTDLNLGQPGFCATSASSTDCSSSGNAEASCKRSPVIGCSNASDAAWRNGRVIATPARPPP